MPLSTEENDCDRESRQVEGESQLWQDALACESWSSPVEENDWEREKRQMELEAHMWHEHITPDAERSTSPDTEFQFSPVTPIEYLNHGNPIRHYFLTYLHQSFEHLEDLTKTKIAETILEYPIDYTTLIHEDEAAYEPGTTFPAPAHVVATDAITLSPTKTPIYAIIDEMKIGIRNYAMHREWRDVPMPMIKNLLRLPTLLGHRRKAAEVDLVWRVLEGDDSIDEAGRDWVMKHVLTADKPCTTALLLLTRIENLTEEAMFRWAKREDLKPVCYTDDPAPAGYNVSHATPPEVVSWDALAPAHPDEGQASCSEEGSLDASPPADLDEGHASSPQEESLDLSSPAGPNEHLVPPTDDESPEELTLYYKVIHPTCSEDLELRTWNSFYGVGAKSDAYSPVVGEVPAHHLVGKIFSQRELRWYVLGRARDMRNHIAHQRHAKAYDDNLVREFALLCIMLCVLVDMLEIGVEIEVLLEQHLTGRDRQHVLQRILAKSLEVPTDKSGEHEFETDAASTARDDVPSRNIVRREAILRVTSWESETGDITKAEHYADRDRPAVPSQRALRAKYLEAIRYWSAEMHPKLRMEHDFYEDYLPRTPPPASPETGLMQYMNASWNWDVTGRANGEPKPLRSDYPDDGPTTLENNVGPGGVDVDWKVQPGASVEIPDSAAGPTPPIIETANLTDSW